MTLFIFVTDILTFIWKYGICVVSHKIIATCIFEKTTWTCVPYELPLTLPIAILI